MRILSLLALFGCQPNTGKAPSAPPPARVAPDQVGPYAVGAVTLELDDPRYDDPLTVEVWYPAIDPGTEPDFYTEIAIRSGAHRDATLDKRGAPYPLVAFSHGFGGIRYQSAFLTEHLASHGFVVVAPDHPFNTLLDLDPTMTGQVLVNRPGDVIAAVDGALADPRFSGQIDGEVYAMTGHSFGGLTTLIITGAVLDFDFGLDYCDANDSAGCGFFDGTELGDPALAVADPRAIVGVDLNPGGWYAFGERGLDGVQPTLAIAGTRDADLPYEREGVPLMERLPAPKTLVSLENAGHWGVTDLCQVIPFFDDCRGQEDGWMEPERVQEVVRTLTTAWVGSALTDDPIYQGWTSAEAWPDDDVAVEEVGQR